MQSTDAILSVTIPELPLVKKGKVREVYDVSAVAGEELLLFIASDRISAFDVIMPNGIPDKGKVLTQISRFWFERFKNDMPHHLVSTDIDAIIKKIPVLKKYTNVLSGRAMLVRKSQPLAIECVVRGYLAGSGLKEYKQTMSVCGIRLPAGLRESDKLPDVIFTPATKAETGHDENIDERKAREIVGDAIFTEAKNKSIFIYLQASQYARQQGIIIADTKFEFGVVGKQLILIDEVLTPDSSRFWPAASYTPGQSQLSFDKQFVRDYLESLKWNKTPPAPVLPPDVVAKTREKYLQSYELLTGKKLIDK